MAMSSKSGRRRAGIMAVIGALSAAGGLGVVGAVEASDPVVVSVSDVTITEPDTKQRAEGSFVASIAAPVERDIVFKATTRNATAVAKRDYQFFTRRIRIPAGETSVEIPLRVIGDLVLEDTETLRLVLSRPGSGVEFSAPEATATILDDDAAVPSVSISDLEVTEAGIELNTNVRGNRVADLKVSLSSVASAPVTVSWRAIDGDAVLGEHYLTDGGSVLIRPGETIRRLPVRLAANDKTPEPDRSFRVEITSITGPADIGNGAANVVVRDDDHIPKITMSADPEVVEGDTGTTSTVVTLTLDRPSERVVRVFFELNDGTATRGDYVKYNSRHVIRQWNTSHTFALRVRGDTTVEGDEFFTFDIVDVPNATIDRSTLTVTILDDD